MKFQDKFYDIIHHNNCPSSEKSAEKCILRKSYFHHSEPIYDGSCTGAMLTMQTCTAAISRGHQNTALDTRYEQLLESIRAGVNINTNVQLFPIFIQY